MDDKPIRSVAGHVLKGPKNWGVFKTPAQIMDKIESTVEVDPNSGCWLWTGRLSQQGYGIMRNGPLVRLTHRLAYEAAFGVIPEGFFALHSCDTPACCNPRHVRPGTQKENMEDKFKRGRFVPGGGGNPKLTREQVQELVSLHQEGASIKTLSRRYGISTGSIRNRINRPNGRFADACA